VTGPWWAAFGPAETQVDCGSHQHVIRWADGRLDAASHADAEGELVMAALGGEPPRCVQLVQAWGAHADDLEVLAIGPRSAADRVSAVMPGDELADLWPGHPARGLWPNPSAGRLFTRAMFARRRHTATRGGAVMGSHGMWSRRVGISSRLVAAAPGSRPMIPARRGAATMGSIGSSGGGFFRARGQDRAETQVTELRMLFALGQEFQWRLSGAVAAAWSADRPGHDRAAARPALTAALAGRLAPIAQAWLGADPGRVDVTLHDGPGWGRLAATTAAAGAGQQFGTAPRVEGDEAGAGPQFGTGLRVGGDEAGAGPQFGTGLRVGGGEAARDPQPGLTAALPSDWLARVWAPGLALVAGRLVVAVPEAEWPRARVLALAAPGAEPAPLDVRWEAGQWRPAPG
jgi:hypothetical protein